MEPPNTALQHRTSQAFLMNYATAKHFLEGGQQVETLSPTGSYIPPAEITSQWFKSALDWSFIYPDAPYGTHDRKTPPQLHIEPLEEYGHWLRDERSIRAICLLNEFCGGAMRSFGPQVPEFAHVFWTANANYNDPDIRNRLAEAKIDPVAAVVVALWHDAFEDIASPFIKAAKKHGALPDLTAIHARRMQALNALHEIFPEPEIRRLIKAVSLDYMTDRDPTKRGIDRILAQHMMPVDADGELAGAINIKLRGYDKGHNGLFDGFWRAQYEEAEAKGLIPAGADLPTKRIFGLPDENLNEAIDQLTLKYPAIARKGASQPVLEACKNTLDNLLLSQRRMIEKNMYNCAAGGLTMRFPLIIDATPTKPGSEYISPWNQQALVHINTVG